MLEHELRSRKNGYKVILNRVGQEFLRRQVVLLGVVGSLHEMACIERGSYETSREDEFEVLD